MAHFSSLREMTVRVLTVCVTRVEQVLLLQILVSVPLIVLWEGVVVSANPSSGTSSLCPGEEHGTGSGGDSHARAEGEPDSLALAQHITSSKLRKESILEQCFEFDQMIQQTMDHQFICMNPPSLLSPFSLLRPFSVPSLSPLPSLSRPPPFLPPTGL